MTGKLKRWVFLVFAILIAIILGFCQNKDIRQKICSGICDAKPEIFRFVNKTYINGKLEKTSGGKLYVTSKDGDLVEPSDVTWERAPGTDIFAADKREGLDRECFSEEDFPVVPLDSIMLNSEDVTITILNFNEEGRVESYDLVDRDSSNTPKGYPTVLNSLFGTGVNNFVDIQQYLSGLTRAEVTPGNNNPVMVQAKDLNGMTDENTPFDTTLQAASDKTKGHVVFYVLADSKITFSRGPFAMISYAPEADNAIGELYSPYIAYPIEPEMPRIDKLDVLVVHFLRGGGMKQKEGSPCRYPYDLAVVAQGQEDESPVTPLLIDPETTTHGSFP